LPHRSLARYPDQRYDLIVAIVTFRWRKHASNILSLEFMRLIRAQLERGGACFSNATSSPEAFKTGLAALRHGFRVFGFLTVSEQAPPTPAAGRKKRAEQGRREVPPNRSVAGGESCQ
jgi:hypothetical protein